MKNRLIKPIIGSIAILFVLMYGCFNNAIQKNPLPVVDLTKEYPEKQVFVDGADTDYIALETTTEVLTDRDFRIEYVSDNRIAGINRQRGDIFVFDRNGRIISFFNRMGNSGIEYQFIQSIVFDEPNSEIFILDYQTKNRCAVYSEEGVFLRQFYFPANSWIKDLYNFDDETLLVYNDVRVSGLSDNDINQKMPYVFLSKKDGSIISRVNLSFSKRNSNTLVTYKGNDGMNSVTINTPHRNVKFGQEFIIADMSTDTVFLLSQDKILKPIFVRKPSVFNNDMQQYVMVVHFKTNKYLFFLTYLLDWNEVKRQTERGERYRPSIQHFGYDLQTGEVFTPVGRYDVALSMDVPENTFVMKHSADIFIERFGKIIRDGKLKQVTQPLKEEDNHVIQIIKYK